MTQYLLHRSLWVLLTLLGLSFVAFELVALAPGDPITAELRALGISAKPHTVEQLRREFDLDAPVVVRYARWLGRCARLDLGRSIATGRPVAEELRRAALPTFILTFETFLLIVFGSVVLAYTNARVDQAGLDRALRWVTIAGVSLPTYWLALIALRQFQTSFAAAAVVLSLGPSLSIARVLKQRIDAERTEDYVRFAIATGASRSEILLREMVRPVLPLLFALWGTTLGYLIGGSIVVERIFGIAGLGNLALQAISARDYPVIQSYLLLAGTLFLISNWLADILSAWADPRLRQRGLHD